jgi:raffinose/stachyose/melibiose transport system permease protein
MKKNKNKGYRSTVNKTMKSSLKKYFPIFMLPTMIAFAIGFVWPFLWGIYLSFFKFKTLKFKEFNGLNNYILAFQDNTFLNAFKFTAIFAVVSVILINLCAFALALALTSKVKGSTIFRTIFFMPNLVGGIVLAYVWKSILNEMIHLMFDSQLVLETKYGFWSLIILLCWQQIGYMMIIYIAGLQNVPSEFKEAAVMDGANGWQILRKIIIPTVMPSITICLFLSLTNSFKLFDQNLALTGGSPNKTTEMMALNIYNSFYQSSTNMGIGQAKAVVFFVIVVAISLIQLYFTKRKEVQQ